MARLELRKVKQVSRLNVSDRPITIGRSSESSVVLADNHVSRQHCVIEVVNGKTRIRDLDSHGGTFVNGKRVTQAPLHHGDRISVGPYDLMYKDPNSASESVMVELEDASGVSTNGVANHAPCSTELTDLRSKLQAEQAARAKSQDELAHLSAQLVGAREQIQQLTRASDRSNRERDAALDDLQAARASLAEMQTASEQARQEVASRQAEFDEAMQTIQSLEQRIDQLQFRHDKELAHAQRDHDAARREIEKLHSHEVTLQEQVDALESSRRIAADRAEQLTRAMNVLQSQVGSLHDAAGHVSSLQDRLSQIEMAWGEVDQQIEDADGDNSELIEQAAFERHRISEELEALHQQRDAAVLRLREAAESLRSLSERPIVRVVNIAPARVGQSLRSRPWWKFGK